MLIRGRLRAAGLAAVVAAGVTGCTGPAVTGAQHPDSPVPRAIAVLHPGRSHPGLDSLVRGHAGLRPAGGLTPDPRLGPAFPAPRWPEAR